MIIVNLLCLIIHVNDNLNHLCIHYQQVSDTSRK
uniref:Uncharacterized protein n=1 Tax=Arundo donax TaxID=35708 RepID=A0A0A9B4R3_ARUDO